MGTPQEFKFSGCKARYAEGTILLESDVDPEDRFVWTISDAEFAARVFRHLVPELANALKVLASTGRIAMIRNRRSE